MYGDHVTAMSYKICLTEIITIKYSFQPFKSFHKKLLSYKRTQFYRYCRRAKAVFKELELKKEPYVVELDQRGSLYIH
jgi:hypothetical protein